MNCSTEAIEFLARESTCTFFLLFIVIIVFLLVWNYMRVCEKALNKVEDSWKKFSESKNDLVYLQAQFLFELIKCLKAKNSDETESNETEEKKDGE